ncbi:MAG TPA: glycoside hydrolase family 2 TIM barrel-domain containing protein, partial [Candidatus Acidoferrum sp.]|nr:glycoside hydrolase family 2 TIM barrel-domain containing protein [Candidatus Acidoferrum sp.]
NYRANVWLNGNLIASTNDIFGAFRIFKLDVSGLLRHGRNVLALEIFPPQPGDFTMGFVDWNPQPADREMGLWRPAKLHFYKSVALDNVFVESKIDHANWQNAALTIHADLKNQADYSVNAQVTGEIGDISFSQNFALRAGENRTVELTPERNPQLNIQDARLWWPWELGEPHLYPLKLAVSVDGEVSDLTQTRFGIREVRDYITPEGYRGYMINGKKILLRGGGWADELLLRENKTNLETQIKYTKAMNLNTIRLEGIWGSSQRLYDLADENGLFVMVGFSCQWEWTDYLGKACDNFGGFKSETDMALATNYLHDQALWLRNHPSVLMWVVGSDKLPRPELEKKYDSLLAQIDPTRPVLKTCGDAASQVSGPSGVKMNGPYDYVTPNYWYLDSKNGGAFGFNTETGPGPEPPPLETLQRMIPAQDLWPIDSVWDFHCGRHEFARIKRYLNAFQYRYGAAAGADEFAFKSQAANYEGIRPMYEAFAANLPHTTGIIQWMLNPSWPKLYWQLYDYYLVPGGAFFGAKKGAAPFAVIYNYGDKGIYLVNQTGKSLGNCQTTLDVYDLNSKKILEQTVTNTGAAYGSQKIFDLSNLAPQTPVYFLDLHTRSDSGASADNFYWLSTKPDVLDEDKTEWYVTPNKSFADFTALNQMPEATAQAHVKFETYNAFGTDTLGAKAEVTLTNTSDSLAFFIEMRVVGEKSRQSLTPVFWDDNYVSLPPHTTKTFHADFPDGPPPQLKLRGWNVKFENVTTDQVMKL